MILLKVEPHTGVGQVRFGMARVEVARVLGARPQRFTSNEFALEQDSFDDLGMNVSYDEQGHCVAVGFARHSGVDLQYDDLRLFSHPAIEVRAWAWARDPELDPKDGFTSKLLGLNMWADWLDDADVDTAEARAVAGAFLVFRPNYCEDESERMRRAGLVVPFSGR